MNKPIQSTPEAKRGDEGKEPKPSLLNEPNDDGLLAYVLAWDAFNTCQSPEIGAVLRAIKQDPEWRAYALSKSCGSPSALASLTSQALQDRWESGDCAAGRLAEEHFSLSATLENAWKYLRDFEERSIVLRGLCTHANRVCGADFWHMSVPLDEFPVSFLGLLCVRVDPLFSDILATIFLSQDSSTIEALLKSMMPLLNQEQTAVARAMLVSNKAFFFRVLHHMTPEAAHRVLFDKMSLGEGDPYSIFDFHGLVYSAGKEKAPRGSAELVEMVNFLVPREQANDDVKFSTFEALMCCLGFRHQECVLSAILPRMALTDIFLALQQVCQRRGYTFYRSTITHALMYLVTKGTRAPVDIDQLTVLKALTYPAIFPDEQHDPELVGLVLRWCPLVARLVTQKPIPKSLTMPANEEVLRQALRLLTKPGTEHLTFALGVMVMAAAPLAPASFRVDVCRLLEVIMKECVAPLSVTNARMTRMFFDKVNKEALLSYVARVYPTDEDDKIESMRFLHAIPDMKGTVPTDSLLAMAHALLDGPDRMSDAFAVFVRLFGRGLKPSTFSEPLNDTELAPFKHQCPKPGALLKLVKDSGKCDMNTLRACRLHNVWLPGHVKKDDLLRMLSHALTHNCVSKVLFLALGARRRGIFWRQFALHPSVTDTHLSHWRKQAPCSCETDDELPAWGLLRSIGVMVGQHVTPEGLVMTPAPRPNNIVLPVHMDLCTYDECDEWVRTPFRCKKCSRSFCSKKHYQKSKHVCRAAPSPSSGGSRMASSPASAILTLEDFSSTCLSCRSNRTEKVVRARDRHTGDRVFCCYRHWRSLGFVLHQSAAEALRLAENFTEVTNVVSEGHEIILLDSKHEQEGVPSAADSKSCGNTTTTKVFPVPHLGEDDGNTTNKVFPVPHLDESEDGGSVPVSVSLVPALKQSKTAKKRARQARAKAKAERRAAHLARQQQLKREELKHPPALVQTDGQFRPLVSQVSAPGGPGAPAVGGEVCVQLLPKRQRQAPQTANKKRKKKKKKKGGKNRKIRK